MKDKHSYILCAGCMIFMSVMLTVAAVTHESYRDTVTMQQDKIMRLKADSTRMSQDIRHLMQWHQMSTPEQQRDFINRDKKNRIHDKNHSFETK